MTGPAERARLAELARKDDAGKLVLLAAWFDIHDAKSAANGYPSSGDEVQSDLRRIAARLAALEAENRRLMELVIHDYGPTCDELFNGTFGDRCKNTPIVSVRRYSVPGGHWYAVCAEHADGTSAAALRALDGTEGQ